jgi:hypothetical protein
MEENTNFTEHLKKALLSYLSAKAEPYIEMGVTKISHLIGTLFSAGVWLFTFFMGIVFSGITIALVLNDFLGKPYWGFLIVTVTYLIFGAIVWSLRERLIGAWIRKLMLQEIKKTIN